MASQSRQDRRAAIPPALVTRLTRWFSKNARDLPWRRNPTPYRVWVSEVMLQQTRVEVVRGYFQRFMKRFPTVKALAAAHEDEVLAAWSGLGYYRRARMLHAAAKQIVAQHNGRFPRDAAAIEALPGVGRYTAGAIRSIAFNEPAPIVDGNVERVFARLFAIRKPIKSAQAQRHVWNLARDWVTNGKQIGHQPRELNEALMELGATVCTPRAPQCQSCPAAAHCAAMQQGLVANLPVTERPGRVRKLRLLCLVLRDDARRVWLVRRAGGNPPSLLPDGLWELPHTEWPANRPDPPVEQLQLGVAVAPEGGFARCPHSVMDWRVDLVGVQATASGAPIWRHGDARWATTRQARGLAMASATRKVLARIAG